MSTLDALTRLRQVATDQLRNTYQLMSSPPKSAAAWDIRNAIDKEIAALGPSRSQQFLAWALGTFGVIALDPNERAARFTEEAIELAHATGMPQSLVDRIVTRVYSRPPGNLAKEIGQAAVTLEMLAQTSDLCVETEAEREWQRVQSIPREQWTKRHDAKVALGIAG